MRSRASRGGVARVRVMLACAPAREAPEPSGSGWSPARIEGLEARLPGLLRTHAVPGVAVVLTSGDHGLELAEEVVGIRGPKPHPLFQFYMLHPDD